MFVCETCKLVKSTTLINRRKIDDGSDASEKDDRMVNAMCASVMDEEAIKMLSRSRNRRFSSNTKFNGKTNQA